MIQISHTSIAECEIVKDYVTIHYDIKCAKSSIWSG